MHRPHRHAGAVQFMTGLGPRARCGPGLDTGTEDALDMHAPARGATDARIGQPFRMTHRLGQGLHLHAPAAQHDEVAVTGAERRDDVGRGQAVLHAQRVVVQRHVGQGHHGVVHGNVDVLADAIAIAMAQRGQHADHHVQAGGSVAQRAGGADHRRLVRLALEVVETGHGLDHRREGRPLRIRRLAVRSEAADGGVDHLGMHRRDVLVAEAHFLHRAGAKVLRHDVEPGRQSQDEIAPLG